LRLIIVERSWYIGRDSRLETCKNDEFKPDERKNHQKYKFWGASVRLKRYLQKEVISSALAILVVLMLIFLSQQMVRYLGEVVDGKIGPDLLFWMVGLQMPPLLGFLLPLALFLGVLLAFGQLYVDHELTVMKSVGVGDRQLVKLLLPLAIGLSIIAALFTLVVTPWSAQKQQLLLSEQDKQSELSLLTPGKFQMTSDGSAVLYASASDKGVLSQLLYAQLPTDEQPYWQILSTQNAFIDTELEQPILSLRDGEMYRFSESSADWQVTAFGDYQMAMSPSLARERKVKLRSVSTIDLLSDLNAETWAEFHWRLSVPISVTLLLLMSVPLARVEPRQGKYAKMFPALLVYMSYTVLLLLVKGLIEDRKLPGAVGMWPIHAAYFGYALWLYRHSHRRVGKSKVRASS